MKTLENYVMITLARFRNVAVTCIYSSEWRQLGPETFLEPSANKQTHIYDTECSKHHPSLSTLKSKVLSRSKTKWWAIYSNLPVITHDHTSMLYIYIYISISTMSYNKKARWLYRAIYKFRSKNK